MFIVNPIAGAETTRWRWLALEVELRRLGRLFDVEYSGGEGEAMRLAMDAVYRGYDRVIAVGGDGTISEVANGLLRQKDVGVDIPKMGLLSTGRGRDLARSLNVPLAEHAALARLFGNQTIDIDIGKLTYRKDGIEQSRYFLNFAGIGLDAAITERANRMRILGRGTITYLVAAFSSVTRLHPCEMEIEIDGVRSRENLLTLIVANGRYFGGGMKVAPPALLDDGLLDIIGIGDFGRLGLLCHFHRLYSGTHLSMDKVIAHRGTKITVHPERELPVQVDGIQWV